MIFGLALLALIVSPSSDQTVSPAPQPRVKVADPRANLPWPQPPATQRFRIRDIVLTMRNEVSGADSSDLRRLLDIEAPGLPAFTMTEEAAYPPSVMVAENPSGSPVVLFQTYSGGAHCCTTVRAIAPRDNSLEAVELYSGDGGPLESAPIDVDGDGALDFVFHDNAFLYRFASYADSFAPPVVLNVIDGRAVDVSDRAGFRPLFEQSLDRSRRVCSESADRTRNGACAALVAAAARLGRFDEAWAQMLTAYDRTSAWGLEACQAPTADGDCPEGGKARFRDFPQALRAFLVEQGYLPG